MKVRGRAIAFGGARGVVLGNAIGAVCTAGVTPFLSRIYTPSDVGLFQLALAISLVALPVATLRLELVIPGRTRLADSQRLVRLSRASSAGVVAVLVIFALTAWVSRAESEYFEVPLLAGALVGVLSAAVVDNARKLREGSYRSLAYRNALTGLFGAILQISLGLVDPSWLVLGVSLCAGRAAAVLVTLDRRAGSDLPGTDTSPYDAGRLASSIGATMLANVSAQGGSVIANATLGTSAAGQFALAQRVSAVPIQLLSQGLTQASTGRLNAAARSERAALTPAVVALVRRIGAVGLLGAVAVAVGALVLGPTILGHQWVEASRIAAITALPSSYDLVAPPVSIAFTVTGHQRLLFLLYATRAALVVLVFSASAVLSGSLYVMAISGSVVLTVWFAVYLRTVLRVCRRYDDTQRGVLPEVPSTQESARASIDP